MNPHAIGLFGGTFDPMHLAHLRMARAFIEQAGLSQLRVIPAGSPYHRQQPTQATAAQRLEMVRLALAGQPAMVVDDREIQRDGPSFTMDTLEEVRAEVGTEVPLWLLIGADSLKRLDTWKRWTELFDLAHLAVAMRPGFSEDNLSSSVRQQWMARQSSRLPIQSASGTILRLVLPPLDLSASAIRDSISKNIDISHLVPPAIASYICEQGLYRLSKG